ncbi:MAG: type I-F CRISPR-associated protein Cas7f/Csy3 [Colwellia sp.]|nr:type I-F CRISPR-associated protein Cas7f/Csy3 [Colwellia sp.]
MSVKIGAAIQKIDDWYSNEPSKPIRAHEYGADSELVIARRPPQSKLDFYSLLSNSCLNEM